MALRSLALVLLLLTSSTLSGCIDTLFPQREEIVETPDDGLLRVWAAARAGAVGNEFVHYNVTFGGIAHARDLLLEDMRPMDLRHPTIDLAHLEKERKTVQLARARIPEGDYSGFGFYVSQATLGVERVVGSQGGNAITEIQETPIEYSSTVVALRATHIILPGRTTDLFIEIDLQRSLQRGDNGDLRHVTVPAGVAVHVDNKPVKWHPMDGGASRLPEDDPRRQQIDEDRDSGVPPSTSLQIFDPETQTRHYLDRTQPLKRMNRAVGLGEDIVFDASRSVSNVYRADLDAGTVDYLPIIEYRWDFGDGTVMTGARVTKNYTKGGLFDVTLTVRDSNDNVARDHVSLFVPYTASQAVATRTQTASGSLLLGTSEVPLDSEMDVASDGFSFPSELDNGSLRIGGYRVRLESQDPLGGNLLGLQSLRLVTDSGHFKADETRYGPHDVQTAGIPVWRGPLKSWAHHEIDVDVQLMTGLMVDYELIVEAQYYDNLSRGLDPHSDHIHPQWPFGPAWGHLHWNGSVPGEDDD